MVVRGSVCSRSEGNGPDLRSEAWKAGGLGLLLQPYRISGAVVELHTAVVAYFNPCGKLPVKQRRTVAILQKPRQIQGEVPLSDTYQVTASNLTGEALG